MINDRFVSALVMVSDKGTFVANSTAHIELHHDSWSGPKLVLLASQFDSLLGVIAAVITIPSFLAEHFAYC